MSEWIELPDASTGKLYYANMKTNAKSWKMPKGFVTDDCIVKEGYLQKRSKHVKQFRKRWIVFKENCLYSYKTAAKREMPTEKIELTPFTFVQQSNNKNKKLGQFELIISKIHQMTEIRTEKTRVFIASSVDEMESWISCIEKAFADQNTKPNKHINPKRPNPQKRKKINLFKSMGAKLRCASSNTKADTEQDMDCYNYYVSRNRKQVKEWLNDIALNEYYENLMQNGFDTLDIIKTNLRNDTVMLKTIGITKIGHQMTIIESIEKLCKDEQNEFETINNNNNCKSELQFPVIDCLNTTWKCVECYNVNSNQISVCLKCGEKKYNTQINKKWLKKAVDV